ncbi:MAG: PAS domain S-box protein [Terriglobia bacterium]
MKPRWGDAISTRPDECKPINILMVENDPVDAELCSLEFRRAGIILRTDVVQTPEDFRLKLKERSYDVVLADYNLGSWTGLEAFEYSRRQGCETPFILVTGAVEDEAAVEWIKKGISDYVLKDRLARLPVAVKKAIAEKSLREERTRAQRMAWEKERRFLSLMENSADGTVLLNARGIIVFSSRAESRILGYPAEERTGANFCEYVHPEDTPALASLWDRLTGKPGDQENIQLRYQTKDGSWLWLECIMVNLMQESTVQGIVVNYRDISERKRNEGEIRRLNEDLERRVVERTVQLKEANRDLQGQIVERERTEKILRESQERFRLLVDGVRDYAIFMLDPQGRVASWNAGAERIKGYRAEEILGRHISCCYTQEDVEQGGPEHDLQVAATEGRIEMERRIVRRDGSEFWGSVILTALRDPSGQLRGFSKVTRDITGPRRTHEAMEKLRLQQQLILNSAGEGIYGLDEAGVCTFANPAGARIAGCGPQELIGKELAQVICPLAQKNCWGSNCDCPIQAALRDGMAHHVDGEVFTRKDGATIAVDFVATPILSETGRILGAVVVLHDVTERRAVEKMKDEFISVVSHELRTPLTAIHASLGLLASGKLCPPSGKCQPLIALGVANTDRMVRLINDILDIERIESGEVTMAKKWCDAADLLTQAVGLMRVMAEQHDMTIRTNPLPVSLWADQDRIIQVLINLLNNAIKFSPDGSAIQISAEQKNEEIVFRVADTGRGIPSGNLGQIFERFQQVDASDSRERGGTGLGLPICRSIIAQHGGRIWVESTLGQGSTFFFALPARDAAAANANAICDVTLPEVL